MNTMHLKKTKKRLVTQYFLGKLRQIMQTDAVNPIDNVFLSIYSRDELLDIIKWLYIPTVPEWIRFEEMDKASLLEVIGDDFHILCYEMEQANLELYESIHITPKRVCETLQQLELETHYLMEKPLDQWDEYDSANYQALARKAGNPSAVFGIYDSSVQEEDKYCVTTPPPTFFITQQEASIALDELIETGKFKKEQIKIMML